MTNNPRFFLWAALLLIALVNYQTWTQDYAPPPQAPAAAAAPSGASTPPPTGGLENRIPSAAPSSSSAAAAASGTAASRSPEPGAAPSGPVADAVPSSRASTIHVRTDVLDLKISTQGGTIEQADLLQYPRVKGQSEPVRLENQDEPASVYLLQSGLSGPDPTPTHLALYTATQHDYALNSGSELRVPLTWTGDQGITVTKTYVFKRGSYRIDIEYAVQNHSETAWQATPYAQILRNDPRTKRSMFNVESYAFHGPAIYDGTKYRKLDTADKDDSHLSLDVKSGWVAALQHHFVSAIVPPPDQQYRFTLNASVDEYLLTAAGATHTVAPGNSDKFGLTLYIGPKLQGQLKQTSPELARAADYGHLYFLAQPLFKLLSVVHAVTGNWGIAIIFVTFLLKLLFYPLSEASGRSMAKMKQLSPRIKNLQETYKDDREKLGRAMMELYQREKINPVAGCLPIIIQIPVFLAFYWVLLESVEMRQAPFAFWIHDLSSRDPFFVLPAIMAVAMFVQYKLNPQAQDPVQAKVFMFMPLVMSAMFAFFPAGLVLYWVTNTILSIAQQWNINRRVAAAAIARKA